jgi:hypothetical protein
MVTIVNWRDLINKPVYSSDRKEVGVVSDVQPMNNIATSGPMTPDKYNIPENLWTNSKVVRCTLMLTANS